MTAASGADQPTPDEYAGHVGSCRMFYAERRCTCGADQLAEYLRHHQGSAETADELAAVLLPFVEHAKAEGGAEALEKAAEWARGASNAFVGGEAEHELRFRAASLRATTGQPPDGGDVR